MEKPQLTHPPARPGDFTSAESIQTLKNRESIHFGFLLRVFVEKELIHETWIDSLLYNNT